jgi:urea transport system substrate-binding protein
MITTSLSAVEYPTAQVNTTGLAVTDDTVTVGQLHSATGAMAISETGSIGAEQLAIDQINAQGDVLVASVSAALLAKSSYYHANEPWTFTEESTILAMSRLAAGLMTCPSNDFLC